MAARRDFNDRGRRAPGDPAGTGRRRLVARRGEDGMMPVVARRACCARSPAGRRWRCRGGRPRGRGRRRLFRAARDGSEIGWHRLAFRTDGEHLLVEIEISFEVSFAFLTLYRYQHRSRETWRGRASWRWTPRPTTTASATRSGRAPTASGWRSRPRPAPPDAAGRHAADQLLAGGHVSAGRRSTPRAGGSCAPGRAPGRAGARGSRTRVRATRYRLQGDLDCELWYTSSAGASSASRRATARPSITGSPRRRPPR